MALSIVKPTLTIGIPAHNEENNIAQLLDSIQNQQTSNYRLNAILIVCDGCTDNTVKIVKTIARKNKKIKLVECNIRSGKASVLNIIYNNTRTDLLLTMDADLIFNTKDSIEKMIDRIISSNKIKVVGPRHIPAKAGTIFGHFARYSYLSFEDAFLKLNGGSNSYAIMSVELMKRDFYSSFRFPKGVIADQAYVYAKATQKSLMGFTLVKEAEVLFGTAQTVKDWRILSARSVRGDKADVVNFFGKKVLKNYSMPKFLLFKSLTKWFFKNPFYLTGSVVMNIFIRLFPYQKQLIEDGVWEIVTSSKKVIKK